MCAQARSICGSWANELADEQAEKGSACHPSAAQAEQSYSARASFLGWLAKFLGELHACVKFRGWSDVAPRVQRQRRRLPRKLVLFQREPRKKRATHAKISRTHALAKTAIFGSAGGADSTPHKRARGTASRSRAEPERSTQEAQGWQKPKGRTLAGGANQACGGLGGRGLGGCDGNWMGLA